MEVEKVLAMEVVATVVVAKARAKMGGEEV